MHCNGLKLSGVLEEFSITSRFLVQKCKNQLFEENKRFECSFYQIQALVVTNMPSRLEKTPNTWHFDYDRFFMNFQKLIIFQIFQNFRKSSAAHAKIIVCVLLYVNMFDKPPCNVMSPFSNDIFYQFGLHFRF